MPKEERLRNISIKNTNLPLILTCKENELLKKPEKHTLLSLQQQALKIARAMQTTLDVYTMIRRFYNELQTEISIQSLHYQNNKTEHKINIGVSSQYAVTYNISTEDMPLGKLTLTLEHKITENENIILENALSTLIYPLRNALLYHRAVINSNTDPLTKLGNRAGFDTALEREIDFAKRHKTPLSLMILDIDKFKKINDNLGHRVADELLIEISKVLKSVCRNSDMIFRYGGDEFIILLGHTPQDGAKNLAQRLRKEIHQIKISQAPNSPHLTASIGLSCFKENDNATSLFDKADKALYTAKKDGRDRIFTIS